MRPRLVLVEPTEARRFVRLRADPARVRVALRPDARCWVATVEARDGSRRFFARSAVSPRHAVMSALRKAALGNLPGVDLAMGWTYSHPQWKP